MLVTMALPLWISFGLIPLLLLTVVLWAVRKWQGRAADSESRPGPIQKDTVLLLGPVDAGKTVLLYQVRPSSAQYDTFSRSWSGGKYGVKCLWRITVNVALHLSLIFFTSATQQLMRGKAVDTVTSVKPGILRGKLWRLRGDPSSPSVRLFDFPGHAQLRRCATSHHH